jgi:hypothetical protein
MYFIKKSYSKNEMSILLVKRYSLPFPSREVAGGKPAKTGVDVPLTQKSDRRKLFLRLCGTRLPAADLEPETDGEAGTPT